MFSRETAPEPGNRFRLRLRLRCVRACVRSCVCGTFPPWLGLARCKERGETRRRRRPRLVGPSKNHSLVLRGLLIDAILS